MSSKIKAAIFGGGIVVAYFITKTQDNKKSRVLCSWTTNFVPSTHWDWNWDRREPLVLAKPVHKSVVSNNVYNKAIDDIKQPTASRHLIFVRHGQYNMSGSFDSDHHLTMLGITSSMPDIFQEIHNTLMREPCSSHQEHCVSLGEIQAAHTGERLQALSLKYDRVIHSTMTRAVETANIILKNLSDVKVVEKCELLREGAPIPPEPPIGKWKPEMEFYIDGPRIEAAFRKYFHRAPVSQENDSYEIIVCHANVIRYFVCRALQFPPEAWLRMSLHNGSLTYLIIKPDGRVILRQLGDCGFMPTNHLSLS